MTQDLFELQTNRRGTSEYHVYIFHNRYKKLRTNVICRWTCQDL